MKLNEKHAFTFRMDSNSNKFMIFDILSNEPDKSIPINEVKKCLNSLRPVHFIYPTHDNKAYVVFNYSDYIPVEAMFSNGKEIISCKAFKIKRFFLDSSAGFVILFNFYLYFFNPLFESLFSSIFFFYWYGSIIIGAKNSCMAIISLFSFNFFYPHIFS